MPACSAKMIASARAPEMMTAANPTGERKKEMICSLPITQAPLDATSRLKIQADIGPNIVATMILKKISKIKRIERYLAILRKLKPDCKKKFLSDDLYQGALLHYLYTIADSCIALAEMIIKEEKLENAESYYEAIDILGTHQVIPANFAYQFAKIASFRNFLAHDYEKIDYLVICEQTLNKLDDIEIYLGHIKAYFKL